MFVVAQRVSTIVSADQIIVLEEGDVVGLGTHQDLLVSSPTYAEIVASQNRGGGGMTQEIEARADELVAGDGPEDRSGQGGLRRDPDARRGRSRPDAVVRHASRALERSSRDPPVAGSGASGASGGSWRSRWWRRWSAWS